MSNFKPEQRRFELGERILHFVAYEGHPARPGRDEPAQPPMWYLMCEGHRCPVMPHELGQPIAERDAALLQWARKNAMGSSTTKRAGPPRARADFE